MGGDKTIKTIINYFKTNWLELLGLLFFLICYASSVLLFLGGNVDPTKPSDVDFPIFLPLCIADLVLMFGFVVFERFVFKKRLNFPLIIILLVFFIINLIMITTTPLEKTFEYVYLDNPGSTLVVVSNEDMISFIMCFALLLTHIYISFNYLLNHVAFKKHFAWICCLGVIGGFIFVINSYITEHETYKLFLENMATTLRSYNPKSFTNNQNSYAAILLGAGFCSYSLFAVTKKHFFWVIGLFFCINCVFPMSRICVFLSMVLTLSIFVYSMIISWKGHEKRNLLLVFATIVIIGLFAFMCTDIQEIKDYIKNVVMTNDSSINSRTPLWKLSFSMTKGIHCVFGNGHHYFNVAFANILAPSGLKYPHNLYVTTYGALGVFGLIGVISLLLFALYSAIKLYKNNREASLISIIGLFIVVIYYLVEG